MYSAVIFDLDQTLVDSSTLEVLRDSGQWDEVYNRLSEVTQFKEVVSLLRVLRAVGTPCAIVTSSPRKYARQLTDRLSIPFDVLVTADDVKKTKPSGEPVRKAIKALSQQDTKNIVLVGDAVDDVLAAQQVGISSILINWSIEKKNLETSTADFTSSSVKELARLLGLRGPATGKHEQQPTFLAGATVAQTATAIQSAEWFDWMQRSILAHLPLESDVYLLGGAVRDALLTSTTSRHFRPRDIDVVVSGVFNGKDSFTSLREILPPGVPLKRTSLDSSILDLGDSKFEFWCLENSFPMQLLGVPHTIGSLLSFVTYDINALAFDCRNAELIGFDDYVASLPSMQFDLHTPQLYIPAFQIARLFLLEKTHKFVASSKCKRFVYHQHQDRYVPFYNKILKHKYSDFRVVDLLSELKENA